MIRGIVSWVVAGALACACSSGSSTNGTPLDDSGNTAGNTQGEPECRAGTRCDCVGGAVGRTECAADGHASCTCPNCSAFDPGPTSTFDACGGVVFGSWELADFDVSAVKGNFGHTTLAGTKSVSCDADTVGDPAVALRLIFSDGGYGSASVKNESVTAKVENSCITGALPVGCESFNFCTLDDCGVCSCEFGRSEASTSGFDRAFNYCVEGDSLTLEDFESHEIFRLARVYTYGFPTACAERTAATCALGPTCHVGQCVGEDCPFADSEGSCTNHLGCAWDTTKCGGVVNDCTIDEYGVVPGCKLSKTAPTCTGTANPCSTYNLDDGFAEGDCEAIPGCKPVEGCWGSLTQDCETGFDVLYCEDCHPGCGCTEDEFGPTCTGQLHCSDQTTTLDCLEMSCQWSSFASCSGTPPDCTKVAPDVCNTVAGCTLTAPDEGHP